MTPKRARILLFLLAAAILLALPTARAAEKPKVRAITAFIRLDRTQFRAQVAEALGMLRKAKAMLEEAGYEVQSLRIATQPFAEYVGDLPPEEALAFFDEYELLAKTEGFDASIGPAMYPPNASPAEATLLGEILRTHLLLNASLTVADENGVRWQSVHAAAKLIKFLSEQSPGGMANFNFAATALVPPHTPFYPGSFHQGPGRRFALALQSANVVAESFAVSKNVNAARTVLVALLGEHAQAIEATARLIEQETQWTYMGIDLSPAPLREISIGAAIETLTGAKVGSSGTMTAAATVTEALRAVPVEHAGYSGLMVPVMEDQVLADRWSEGTLTLDALLSYSAVCGTGLDTIPLPGDISEEQLERIIGDMASLAVKLKKPLSARLMPIPGKGPGDRTEFNDPFLVNATIQRLP